MAEQKDDQQAIKKRKDTYADLIAQLNRSTLAKTSRN